jgi:imidazole glycerol-phosphate synthase subunit HisF
MLRKRIIVCLDVDGGRVVKGVSFRDLRDVGDPVALAAKYEAEGADEIVFLDISASVENRRTLFDVVRATAERLFIPLTVGGGIHSIDDVHAALRSGADKVALNTAAVLNPELIRAAADRFGCQCVVASIDSADRVVHTHGGRRPTSLDAIDWAARCAELGAGEILMTSIDRDGKRTGYDLELTRATVDAVRVPVIASGGAGRASHFADALGNAGADAALAAGIFHDGTTTVTAVKRALRDAAVAVRLNEEVPA